MANSPIIHSCRVRLARNVEGLKFVHHLGRRDRAALNERVGAALGAISAPTFETHALPDAAQPTSEWIAAHRIAPEIASSESTHLVGLGGDGTTVVTCDVDHVRIAAVSARLALEAGLQQVTGIERAMHASLTFMERDRVGYLTACPADAGLGLRASVCLHLPAVGTSEGASKLNAELSKEGLGLKPFWGGAQEGYGHFYLLYNRYASGVDAATVLRAVEAGAHRLEVREDAALEKLKTGAPTILADKLARSIGILRHARLLGQGEAINLLGSLLFGQRLGLYAVETEVVLRLIEEAQTSRLAARFGKSDSAEVEDERRAQVVREGLSAALPESGAN